MKEEKYRKISTEAKTVYVLFIDRLKISIKNQWLDENNNVYIIFTNEEVLKENIEYDSFSKDKIESVDGILDLMPLLQLIIFIVIG